MIDGVLINKLKQIPDERGAIYHMLRRDNSHFIEFGEIYFSIAFPGKIKGWHEHTKQIQNYAVIYGKIKLVLFDNRPQSKTYKKINEIFLGNENYSLVTIPTGIITGYQCVSKTKSILANCSTLPHDPKEMINYNHDGDKVPYDWED
ncbi:dTDP-4-dehydrorhamnose 3,5-epimerase family protein [Candidatus Pelagibacter sp.]|nr:dTDP-4-dehydrorhamnose 3,5-epimerase family protein [Candidatus Pelagibacter sp.]